MASSKTLTLSDHPRLYISKEDQQRLNNTATLPFLKRAHKELRSAADRYLKKPVSWDPGHNELLIRARHMQSYIVTLLCRWQQTDDRQYRKRVLALIQEMHDWEYWSWIAWRAGDDRPDDIFDLSYGENSATLAIAYDWLYPGLSNEERTLFITTAEKWSFAAGLKHTGNQKAWWFGKKDSNWNTVCAGGLGMLALTMYEDSAAARTLLPRCEASIAPFMKYLRKTDGAWPEGIGYWNYGMRYAFMYLLSWQNAHGRMHTLLKHPSVIKTLTFPMDFCPNGVGCSFGDVNNWNPLPFHYRVAEMLGQDSVMAQLDRHDKQLDTRKGWPNVAEWLLLHPGQTISKPKTSKPCVKFYKYMDWAVLADQMPDPHCYMSIRGGTTKVPHGQRDLLSFHCVIDNEALITNCKSGPYLDTTFSARREELFEIGPWGKNTLFINGVGIEAGSSLNKTSLFQIKHCPALRMDATKAMGGMRDGAAAEFCGRLVVMLPCAAYLIIDRFDLSKIGRVESRLHSYHDVTISGDGAAVRGDKASLRINCTASEPALLLSSSTAPTDPHTPSATQLRWCSRDLIQSMTSATLLSAGVAKSSLALRCSDKRISIAATVNGRRYTLSCDPRLKAL